MRIFITGADGFIGSHLVEHLIAAGHDVTGMAQYASRDTYGWLDDVQGCAKVRGDVRDAAQVERLVAGHDRVYHLAAMISVPYSYDAPRQFIDTNVIGTLNVCEACRRTGAELVHLSTSEVYGTAQYVPQDEKHPQVAQSPYAASKIAADRIVESFTMSFDLPATIVRPFNTYGPRQSARAVIPRIILQALDDSSQAIFLGSLEPLRDFTFVSDTVAAVASVDPRAGFQAFNSGTGRAVSIGALAQMISEIVGSGKPVVSAGTRPPDSEVYRLRADASALRNATRWRPRVTLVDGLARTVEWFRGRRLVEGVV